jgi:hypothetical protein
MRSDDLSLEIREEIHVKAPIKVGAKRYQGE